MGREGTESDKRSRTVIHAPVVVCGNSISFLVIEVGIGGESIVVHVVAGRRQVPPSILVVAITRMVPASKWGSGVFRSRSWRRSSASDSAR